ncbi:MULTISPECIES: glutaredoxin family protein [Jonquetella]|uniref:Glutaredoxin-like protein n=1 Tax=Jonquetella anthropi DSM 22815 TaxID=885272 RepID=H0UJ87_9BACT|nr:MULTISPECIES: thioredoxin family protein [Jonquetella]EEX48798.1 glutaredoxin [Jonquetella anthropi E3_33 E1]EHM12820.1 glutaredoxin-like protein [Jonquetella anthropi DSM 22815]ERL24085.1 thioredoxin domain protein [Jonquetella sp. BV3C21]
MKKVTLFYLKNCPHCKRARKMMEDLFAAHPEYKDVPLTMIEESEAPETAGKYDYYLVPTFYVGDEKLHEGVPSPEAVESVFKAAIK